jgi:hypothetical protein
LLILLQRSKLPCNQNEVLCRSFLLDFLLF